MRCRLVGIGGNFELQKQNPGFGKNSPCGFGFGDAYDNNNGEDWQSRTRAHVAFDAKSETEYGTLTSRIVLESNFRGGNTDMTCCSCSAEAAGHDQAG